MMAEDLDYEEYIEKYELSRTDSVEGLLRDLSR